MITGRPSSAKDFVILNLLQHGRCHGYEMVQTLKQINGLKIREGNIYWHLDSSFGGGVPVGLMPATCIGGCLYSQIEW
ncbi:MAG: hypothetical protein ACYTE8_04445 [Planctomycetota bacterium]